MLNQKLIDEAAIREMYSQLTNVMIEKKLTITTMESATGGQIASLITDTEGASSVLKGALITYCNEAKIKQGVPRELIDRYSVYSNEVAEAMALACLKQYPSNIAIGVTGTFGNVDNKNIEASVLGKVYFAIVYNGEVTSYSMNIDTQKNRFNYKMIVAKEIGKELLRIING